MLRRLLAVVLLVLVAIVVFAYVRRERLGTLSARANPPDVAAEARDLGSQAKRKLDEVGDDLNDAKITASVKTALGLNRNLSGYSLDVSTENGAVTLRGKVDSETARARAQAVVADVPDVKRVVNEIQVVPGASASAPGSGRTLGETLDDEALEMKVKLAFSLNRELKGSDISVQAYRKDVTLGGEVTTEAQHERALQVARETPAVVNVVDRIQVKGSGAATTGAAPTSRGPATASTSCNAAGTQTALLANRNLANLNLQVRDEGSRLVLRGTVATPSEKDLAGFVAREAAGCPVENDIEVRPSAL
jgi:hyperosmotically inducible protein